MRFRLHFRERLIMKDKYSPAVVFAAYDEYFMSNEELVYEEVCTKNKETITNLGRFYTEVYMDSFPNPDERETFDSLLSYLKDGEQATEYKYHIVIAKNENAEIVGGCIFDYFPATNAGMIEFLAVKSDMQSSGIGTAIYKHVLSILAEDAFACGNRAVDNIFCEMDSPEYNQAELKKYLYFWDKQKFNRIHFDYIQPSLSQGQNSVDGLWLTVSPQETICTELEGDYVLSVIKDYMRYAMRIDNPDEHEDFLRMKEEIGTRKVALGRVI